MGIANDDDQSDDDEMVNEVNDELDEGMQFQGDQSVSDDDQSSKE